MLVATILMAPAPASAAPIGQGFTVTAADLAYILKQITIAEAHVRNTTSATGPCGALLGTGPDRLASPLLAMGLRTVDGTCNHLTAGQEKYGAADQGFPRLVPAQYRAGYTGANASDAQPRLISNLIADQSAGNPAAVAAAHGADPATGIPNVTTDAGLSAPYNSWFTLFGQFFDHGVDQTVKGSTAVIIPLPADDPLVISENLPPQLRFMVLSRAAGGTTATNTDTPYVDNSQTYTSHAAHQVFLREYDATATDTGRLLSGVAGGLPTWDDVKRQAAEVLGLRLSDADALNVPAVLADAYGTFVPGPARGLPQFVTSSGLVEGDTANPVATPATVLHFDTPFLSDIAHAADPSKPGYDAALLGRHYIAGDGRVNENIGLTAVHQIFHSEHNRLIGDIQRVALSSGVAAEWTGDRLFQAARFINEMEYQHLVFEEFARKIQPAINPFQPFAFTQSEINPAIYAEFAHAVYRFGHSMLTETIARTDGSVPLLDGFLNPDAFTEGGTLSPEQAAGSIVDGMSKQVGNDIDEFVTDTLRNKLLGLPTDLAAINIARGRSEGVPPLNVFRRALHDRSGDGRLTPYVSWIDFGENLKHPASLVNFIAAYGTHSSIVAASGVAAKRAAAQALLDSPSGADFVNAPASESGVDDIDLWIGGLAETTDPFGGLLGSTFDYVFETQLTALQNGDRLYYLARTPGMNLRSQLEGNSFAELIMRNTGVEGLRADVFATADCSYDLSRLTYSGNRVLDDPGSDCDESALLLHLPDGTYKQRNRSVANPQSVWRGTDDRDRVSAGNDDDTVWGGEGDDVLEGGPGNDAVIGGEGDDVLTDSGGDDMPRGGPGNDAINAGPGLDVVLAGDGKDVTDGGANANATFAGEGDDFVIAGDGEDSVWGDAGDDWEEGGDSPDLLQGDSGNLFFLDDANRPGNDVLIGQGGDDDYDMEGGDDIGVQGPGIEKNAGGSGYDWSIAGASGEEKVDSDLALPLAPLDNLTIGVRDRYNEVEALSGGVHDDVLRGDSLIPSDLGGGGFLGCDALDTAGVARIRGLDQVVTSLPTPASAVGNQTGRPCDLHGNVWGGGNILLGGPGDDTLQGRGGDDILDGDRYLTVRLSVRDAAGHELRSATTMRELQADVFTGKINPKDIFTVRETAASSSPDVDTAVFTGNRSLYAITPVTGGLQVAGPDGTDTVRNVELLRFDDQLVDVSGLQAFLGVSAFAGPSSATVLLTVPDGAGLTGLTLSRTSAEGTVLTTLPATTRTVVVPGLTNGVSYTFRVRAESAAGAGTFSAPSTPITPTATSSADHPPTSDDGSDDDSGGGSSGGGSSGDGSSGGDDDNVPVTSPTVTAPTTAPTTAAPTVPAPTTAPTTVPTAAPTTAAPTTTTPVTSGPTAVPTRPAVPVAPDAPRIGLATAGDESAVIRWTAPLHNGGSPIYGYEVQALDDETGIVVNVDATGPEATELTMTGLTNGLPYSFWVRAVNAAGPSDFSTPSNRVTPTPPTGSGSGSGAGSGTGAGSGAGSGSGTGTPGGSGTSTPTATPKPTGSPSPSGGPSTSPTPTPSHPSPSPTSTPTTPPSTSPPTTRTVPGAARIGTPAPGNALAVVRWTAPTSNGGSPLLRYEIRVLTTGNHQAGTLRTAPASSSAQTVAHLTNGTTYRFQVRAVNELGAGPWSPISAAVIPHTAPPAPRSFTATPGAPGGTVTTTLRWTAPPATGGTPITGYRLTTQRLTTRGAPTGAPFTLILSSSTRSTTFVTPPGTRPGTRYRFTLQALNKSGPSPARTTTTPAR
ncbi:hypothetical protein ADL15_06415 [Actinoplanes awajinensis subsp. mycoplanecinus]|uniref:Fibronectin type-III domain-containing protein n=1 Tax=Actinoplanes awajinensis subsp. mycoplanecinus TaxID=135947 RepID=A0A0X3VBF8_9ACTN|nr:hypothetical protein ADL15_06415 [Actinoplanes awajinensis subsp. mycoplanecinus]